MMDFIKLSTDWARAELFSAKIIWVFSVIMLLSAAGFYVWGRTPVARAFIIPLIVSGLLLTVVGVGLYAANKPRVTLFKEEYAADRNEFLKKEIARTTKSQGELNLVFVVLPVMMIVATVLLMLFPSANWRATTVVIILTLAFLMALDSHTQARNHIYREQLLKLASL